MDNVLEIAGLKKTYYKKGEAQCVLRDINLTVERGQFVSLMGKSGSGKSTLLYLIDGLIRPDKGTIAVCGKPLNDMDDHGLAMMRRTKIGFVFQFFNLVKNLNAYDNIILPVIMNDSSEKEGAVKLEELAKQLGIEGILKKFPYEMSGGEQQRVAIARALITSPDIILADEPTGNLDPENSREIMEIFQKIAKQGTAVLQVTHSPEMAKMTEKVYLLSEGELKDTESI